MNEKRKIPFVTLDAGDKSYMLRLTAGAAIRLEERLGCSVYAAIERLTEMRVVTEFLYALLEGFNPEITKSGACLIYDEFINSGGSLYKMNAVIEKALDCSGFFDCGEGTPQQQSSAPSCTGEC